MIHVEANVKKKKMNPKNVAKLIVGVMMCPLPLMMKTKRNYWLICPQDIAKVLMVLGIASMITVLVGEYHKPTQNTELVDFPSAIALYHDPLRTNKWHHLNLPLVRIGSGIR